MEESLAHYGKLGMKWGVRKEREVDYRAKLSRIQNNRNVSPSDLKRFNYRNQPAAARITKTAATVTAHVVVGEVMKKVLFNKQLTKKDLIKDAAKIAVNTATSVALQDKLAKSASKRYTDSGNLRPGVKYSNRTREDNIQRSVAVGIKAAKVGLVVGGVSLAVAKRNRDINESRFNAWGQNILPQKVNNVIWSNDDMAIIDNRRR